MYTTVGIREADLLHLPSFLAVLFNQDKIQHLFQCVWRAFLKNWLFSGTALINYLVVWTASMCWSAVYFRVKANKHRKIMHQNNVIRRDVITLYYLGLVFIFLVSCYLSSNIIYSVSALHQWSALFNILEHIAQTALISWIRQHVYKWSISPVHGGRICGEGIFFSISEVHCCIIAFLLLILLWCYFKLCCPPILKPTTTTSTLD